MRWWRRNSRPPRRSRTPRSWPRSGPGCCSRPTTRSWTRSSGAYSSRSGRRTGPGPRLLRSWIGCARPISLGIVEPRPELVREQGDRLGEGERLLHVDLLGRAVPVVRTPDGLRAVNKGKPGNPARIEKYLAGKFGERLEDAQG